MKIKSLFESIFDNVILTEGVNYGEMFNSVQKYIERIEQVDKFIIDDDPAWNSEEDHETTLQRLFRNMVEDLYTSLDSTTISMISVAKELSPRQDVRVWFMRLVKPYAINRIYGIIVDSMLTSFPQYKTYLFYTELTKIISDMRKEEEELRIQYIGSDFNYPLYEIKHDLTHWLNMPIPAIQDFRFEKHHTYEETMALFRAYEQEWRESGRSSVVPEQGHIIIDFGDGYAWWDLEDASCDAEGDAMGHCGNVPSAGDSDQTIFSLREQTEHGPIPHLTFVYHKNRNALGERKGRGNSKPAAKYHKYIEALIMEPYVEQLLDDESYLPENDFQLTDLPNWKQIWEQKPDLLSFQQYVENIGVDDYILSKVNFIQDSGYRHIETIDGGKTLHFKHEMENDIYNSEQVERFAKSLVDTVSFVPAAHSKSGEEAEFVLRLAADLFNRDFFELFDRFQSLQEIVPMKFMSEIRTHLRHMFQDLIIEEMEASRGMEGRVHVRTVYGTFVRLPELFYSATLDSPFVMSVYIDKADLLSEIFTNYQDKLHNEYVLSIAEIKFQISSNLAFVTLFDKRSGDIDALHGEGWGEEISNNPINFLTSHPVASKYFDRYAAKLKLLIGHYLNSIGIEIS